MTTADAADQDLEEQYRAKEVRHVAWQTWIALAAVIIPSVLAFLAFRDQQAVNRAQQAITMQQQERERRRYADRVAWWTEYGFPQGSVFHLQNRSPAPIDRVEVEGQIGVKAVLIEIGGVPPCTALRLAFPGADLKRFTIQDPPNYLTLSLTFSDPVGRWKSYVLGDLEPQDNRGLSFTSQDGVATIQDPKDTSGVGAALPLVYESVSDCGEDS